MSAPTRPGWYRAVVLEARACVKVIERGGVLVAFLLGEWRPLGWVDRGGLRPVVSEWGSRVEFPGDEPAPDLSEVVDIVAKLIELAQLDVDSRSFGPSARAAHARGCAAFQIRCALRRAGVDTGAIECALNAKHESEADEPAPGVTAEAETGHDCQSEEPEQPWAWVDACPEGQRREQTLEDGEADGSVAIETRVVDRKDEP